MVFEHLPITQLVNDVFGDERKIVVFGHIAACPNRLQEILPPGQAGVSRQTRSNEDRGIAGQNGLTEFFNKLETLNGHALSQADLRDAMRLRGVSMPGWPRNLHLSKLRIYW
ncbi:hypothetical protein VIMS_02675 [Mycobacterium marinum]|nr:hypothetical protein VIMS_02675 [Mycobacterium marinum]